MQMATCGNVQCIFSTFYLLHEIQTKLTKNIREDRNSIYISFYKKQNTRPNLYK